MQKPSNLLELITKYSVAAILLAVPLYPKFPFIRVPQTFVSIRLEDLLIAFAALVWLIGFSPGMKRFFKDGINRSIIIFLAVGSVSLFSAIFVTSTVVPHVATLHLLRRIEYFVPLFLGIEAVRKKPGNLEFYIKILLLVLVWAFIYGFGQKYFSWPVIITQNEEYSKGIALRWVFGSHINSTFAGHYDLATFLVMTLPIIIAAFFLLKNVKQKVGLGLIVLAGLWLLVNTASRISLFSYMFASTVSLFLIKRYKAIPLVLAVSVAFVSFSGNLQARYGRLFEVGKEKIQNILFYRLTPSIYAAEEFTVSGLPEKRAGSTPTPTPTPTFEDRSTSIRFNVEWPRALRAFLKNPLLGTGYSSITLATDNDYLRLLGEVGVLGFLAFFLIFVNFGIKILPSYPFHKNFTGLELAFISGFVGALPGVFVNAIFIDIFEASKFATIFWLFAGMTVMLAAKKNE